METITTALLSIFALIGFFNSDSVTHQVLVNQLGNIGTSVELGIEELSPRGHEGGYAMPASVESSPKPDLDPLPIEKNGGAPGYWGPFNVSTTAQFEFRVDNDGDVDAGTFSNIVQIDLNGDCANNTSQTSSCVDIEFGGGTINSLAKGASFTLNPTWAPTQVGTFRARLIADSGDTINESSESNNDTYWQSFTITAQCSDKIDNDGDGLSDFVPFSAAPSPDPGCDSPDDNSEDDAVPPQCSDGIDNDGDGIIDFVGGDPGCDDAVDDNENDTPITPQCSDGIDNDGDGIIDFVGGDPGCDDGNDDDEVDGPVAPSVTITATPPTVDLGDSSQLEWVVSGIADSCTASNGGSTGWSATTPNEAGGTWLTGPLSVDTTFTIRCDGPGGISAPASVTVTINGPVGGGNHSLEVTGAPVVRSGDTPEICATADDALFCTLSGPDLNEVIPPTGTHCFNPVVTNTSTFTLVCTGWPNEPEVEIIVVPGNQEL